MLDLRDISGFDWDDGNRNKNRQKHNVSVSECEEAFFNLPMLLETDPDHSQKEPRYFVLGQTDTGRYLFIAFTMRSGKIRVISARDMSRKEAEAYEKTNS